MSLGRLVNSLCLLTAMTAGLTVEAEGGVIWNWRYDTTLFEVYPTDSIDFDAILTVDPQSTQHMIDPYGSAYFTGHLQFTYDLQFRWSLFGPNDVAPGESLRIPMGHLVPINGYAAPGWYISDDAGLILHFDGNESPGWVHPDAPFVIHVIPGGLPPEVIPEPGALGLALVGMVVLSLAGGHHLVRRLRCENVRPVSCGEQSSARSSVR